MQQVKIGRDESQKLTMYETAIRPTALNRILGATRMHVDPRNGVVDADCRVHDVPKLFIAGGSVLPTGGSANPALAIVALTLRLAAHLRAELERTPKIWPIQAGLMV